MKEKVVIITGGGKGIGRGVAEAFGEEGANLVITGRHQESLDQAKQELENEFGIQVLACLLYTLNMQLDIHYKL